MAREVARTAVTFPIPEATVSTVCCPSMEWDNEYTVPEQKSPKKNRCGRNGMFDDDETAAPEMEHAPFSCLYSKMGRTCSCVVWSSLKG